MTVDDAIDKDATTHEPSEEELGPALNLAPSEPDRPDEWFAARVRRSIHRRLLGSSILEFCVVAPLFVLREIGTLIRHALRDARATKGARDD